MHGSEAATVGDRSERQPGIEQQVDAAGDAALPQVRDRRRPVRGAEAPNEVRGRDVRGARDAGQRQVRVAEVGVDVAAGVVGRAATPPAGGARRQRGSATAPRRRGGRAAARGRPRSPRRPSRARVPRAPGRAGARRERRRTAPRARPAGRARAPAPTSGASRRPGRRRSARVARQQQAGLAGADPALRPVDPHARRAGMHEHDLNVGLAARAEHTTRLVDDSPGTHAHRLELGRHINIGQRRAHQVDCLAALSAD